MRKKGSNTKVNCWKCEVVNQNEVIYHNEYKTLSEVANDLGLSYSQITEISSNRKKQPSGRFDTNYILTRIKPAEKLNENDDELKEDNSLEEDNPSMNGMSQ